ELALGPTDPSLAHVLNRLAVVERRVQAAVQDRRAGDPNPDDAFRGLYLSEDEVDLLLAQPRFAPIGPDPAADLLAEIAATEDAARAVGQQLRLVDLAARFALDQHDVDILMVALAPDVDTRFEKLYGYLHDDVSRRRASCGLALRLAGLSTCSGTGRARLLP